MDTDCASKVVHSHVQLDIRWTLWHAVSKELKAIYDNLIILAMMPLLQKQLGKVKQLGTQSDFNTAASQSVICKGEGSP